MLSGTGDWGPPLFVRMTFRFHLFLGEDGPSPPKRPPTQLKIGSAVPGSGQGDFCGSHICIKHLHVHMPSGSDGCLVSADVVGVNYILIIIIKCQLLTFPF